MYYILDSMLNLTSKIIIFYSLVSTPVSCVLQNSPLNIRKSQMYLRNLNSISENHNCISENVNYLIV